MASVVASVVASVYSEYVCMLPGARGLPESSAGARGVGAEEATEGARLQNLTEAAHIVSPKTYLERGVGTIYTVESGR